MDGFRQALKYMASSPRLLKQPNRESLPGEEKDLGIAELLQDFYGHFNPIDVRHCDIADNQVRLAPAREFVTFRAIKRCINAVPFHVKDSCQRLDNALFVIDN